MARPRHLTDAETIAQIIAAYTEGRVPTTQLAKTHGTTPSTIRRYLIEAGVTMRPRGRQPQKDS
jgi:transposase-like protein